MPKEVYLRLPEEKKKRVKEAIAEELSRVSLEDFSIRRVTKRAEIARGSFYQYFDGVPDAVLCVLDDYFSNLKALIPALVEEYRYDLFEVELVLFDRLKQYCEESGEKLILSNLGKSFRMSKVNTLEVFPHEVERLKEFIYEHLSSRACGQFTKEDIYDVIHLSALLFRSAISELFSEYERREEISRRFRNQIAIVRRGFITDEGQNRPQNAP